MRIKNHFKVVFYKVCLLNKPKVDIKESEIKSFEMIWKFLRETTSFPESSSDMAP